MKRTWALVGALTAAALALRWYGSWYGWPYVLHPDEPHVVGTAVRFLDPATPDLNPHFFQYPALFLYMTAALYAVVGWLGAQLGLGVEPALLPALYREHPALFHVGARLLSGAFGAAAVPLVFLLGRRLYGTATGLLAAALLAVNFLHVREAHYATTDAAVTFFAVAAVYAAVRVYRSGALGWYLLGGALSGMAAATKYPAGIAVLTVVVAHILRARTVPGTPLLSPRPLVACVAALDVFFVAAPYSLLDPQAFVNALFNEWVAQQVPQSGESTDVAWYYLRALAQAPPVAGLGIATALPAVGYVARQRTAASVLLLAFPLLFYATIGTAVIKVERYFLPILPFIAIAMATLLVRLASAPSPLARWSAAGVTAALLGGAVLTDLQYVTAVAGPDTRVQAKMWLEETLPPGTPVAMIEGAFAWQNPPLSRQRLAVVPIMPPYQDVQHQRRLREQELLAGPFGPAVRALLGEYSVAAQPQPRHARLPRRVDTWTPPSIADLQQRGVDYVVLTDQFRAWALADGTARHFPRAWNMWSEFFHAFDGAELVRRFEPSAPVFGGFAHGGGITVYRLRNVGALVTTQPR